LIGSLKIGRQGAAQFALFAMLIQAMLPLSAAVPVNAEDQVRNGQSIPNFYLVICTAYGAQSQDELAGGPLDKVPTSNAPWDCPVCKIQTSVLGLAPVAPQVVSAPPLPRWQKVPVVRDTRVALWSAAPGLARAPPTV